MGHFSAAENKYGLFYRDTRFLSYLALSINEKDLSFLNSNTVDYYSSVYYLTNPKIDKIKANTLSFIRKKFVGNGMHEDLYIINHSNREVNLKVKYDFDVDFADIFEIKKINLKKAGNTKLRFK